MKKMNMTFGRGLLVLALLGLWLGLTSCGGGGSEEPKTNVGAGQDSKAVQAPAKQPKVDEAAAKEKCFDFLQYVSMIQIAFVTSGSGFGYQSSDVSGIERLATINPTRFDPNSRLFDPNMALNVQLAGKDGKDGFVAFAGHAFTKGSPIYYSDYASESGSSFSLLESSSPLPPGIKIPTALTVFAVTDNGSDYKATIVKTCQVNGVTVGPCTTP
jgi:hypothetical protein